MFFLSIKHLLGLFLLISYAQAAPSAVPASHPFAKHLTRFGLDTGDILATYPVEQTQYALVSGPDKMIYLLDERDSRRPERLIAPGKIIDPKKGGAVFEGRAFHGYCLFKRKNPVYLLFQKEIIDKKRRKASSVLIVEMTASGLREELLERRFPSTQDVLKAVKLKKCVEIAGRNRNVLPASSKWKPIDELDDDDDDEDKDKPGPTANP